jgi:hypothetical protein
MPKISIPRGSDEILLCPVTADVELDAQSVAIAVGRASDNTYTWLAAEWTGTAGTTRTAATSDPVELTAAAYPLRNYEVYVKVTDTPEVPIIHAGTLVIT